MIGDIYFVKEKGTEESSCSFFKIPLKNGLSLSHCESHWLLYESSSLSM